MTLYLLGSKVLHRKVSLTGRQQTFSLCLWGSGLLFLSQPSLGLAQAMEAGRGHVIAQDTMFYGLIIFLLATIIAFFVYAYRVRGAIAKNELLEEQAKIQKQELDELKASLIDASQKADMADSATGVLHNIGNILNSANTCAGVIREVISKSVRQKFIKANGLLKANLDNIDAFIAEDPKGKALLHYYLELEQHFEEEHKELNDNTLRLLEKNRAIKEAIAAQQSYAKGHGFIENLFLQDIVEDALMLQSGSIGRHEITVEKDFEANMPAIRLQKTKVIQILMNLYKNAKESMDEYKEQENLLNIKIYKDDQYAYIRVKDSGYGIEKEKLESIFAYGFSTKIDGHGFGLHSCAKYMIEMGGRLWAESDGMGHGATFILAFSLNPGKVEAST